MPREEMFGYSAQMRRAARSVAANIAEGHGRYSRGDYVRFLAIANGSLKELETQLTIVRTLAWCDSSQLDRADDLCAQTGRTLVALRRALQKSRPPTPYSPFPTP